jgi:hypothetical protein
MSTANASSPTRQPARIFQAKTQDNTQTLRTGLFLQPHLTAVTAETPIDELFKAVSERDSYIERLRAQIVIGAETTARLGKRLAEAEALAEREVKRIREDEDGRVSSAATELQILAKCMEIDRIFDEKQKAKEAKEAKKQK